MSTQWEIIAPDGSRYLPRCKMISCKFAKRLSLTRDGRWTAQRVGSEDTIDAGEQYRYVYESGQIVDKGRVSRILHRMSVIASDIIRQEASK